MHQLFRECGNVTSIAENLLTALIVNERPNELPTCLLGLERRIFVSTFSSSTYLRGDTLPRFFFVLFHVSAHLL